jgi:hypothetical protein
MAAPKPQKVSIKEIKLSPDNPRVVKDDKFKKLVKSIQDFPEMLELRPIVVDEDNVILGGNMRYRALQEAGIKEVYIIKAVGLTEEKKKEFVIKDNVSYGEWDWDIIANDFDTDELKDWGMDIPELSKTDEVPIPASYRMSGEEKMEIYNNMSIKQIVLFYGLEEFEEVVAVFQSIMEQHKLDDNSMVVKFLLDMYKAKQ